MMTENNFKLNLKLIIILSVIVSLTSFFLLRYEIESPLSPKTLLPEEFIVENGSTLKKIAQDLERENLIKNKLFFIFYVMTSGGQSKLKAGTYSFSASMSIKEIAKKILAGDTVKINITIPEGLTIKEIEDKINFQFSIFNLPTVHTQQSILNFQFSNFKVGHFQSEYSFLIDAPKDATLEGFLFPDTYKFSLDATAIDIVRIMFNNFDKKLAADLKEEIQKQRKTIYEIVTMASLIEKEVRTEEDMKLVSGILWKRLDLGMPLQVDASITYLIGKKTTQVTLEDLKIDSPYNTYMYKGLPPGPIANPGLQAIKAAIYPKESDYLYYLSKPAAKGEPRPNGRDGETIFSKTFGEHITAKVKFLR